ncbi:coiled-coil domain-containing protein 66 isoform X6 [Myotis lucifugus]|uniref:coiled-coil domain-containing protein 66 isoform X6 n=1 Tax=Myotis lucifugus TaxID=59463 RepID=UPI000CCC16ED|nr:coiled-coil domain-containing protein 66 isoform X6 [Myotis lucifugus]
MNLGDGLKLETELLDGKTKLILSPYERKSNISVKMGNKTKIGKCPLRTKQTRCILKSTQNTCISSEKLLEKKKIGSETSLVKGEKNSMAKDLCKQYADKDCLHIRKESSPTTPKIQKTGNTLSTPVMAKQKPCKNHITGENMKSSLVCLTQDQLQQILINVNHRNRPTFLTENGKEEETKRMYGNQRTYSVLWGKENVIEICWKQKKPSGGKSLLLYIFLKRTLFPDEQVALKKKEKETPEKWNNTWEKSESDKIVWEKLQILDQSKTSASVSSILSQSPTQVMVVQADGHSPSRASQILEEAVLPEHPFSGVKQEQQSKWIEELNKQIEDDGQRKIEEKIVSSKGEEHDRWAVHFDSQSQLSSRSTYKQPEYFCISPDPQELADISSVYTPTTGSQIEPLEEEYIAKPVRGAAIPNSQKTNFLRSMTALLDPAQIEERDRRRQKQLEHQKAISAQVEEKRRKKQLQEEQRKKEEQEEELRLAREREEMQKQYEEDILKQKQKEEIITVKTNELFQTMQRAQELAQRLKQEQRIRELAEKGHDTSRLIKNLGVQVEFNESTKNISNSRHGLDEVSGKMNTCINSTNSPKKDTGVQTALFSDDLNIAIFTSAESQCGSVMEREIIHCSSPEIPAEFNEQFNTQKKQQELRSQNKGANLEKGNSWCNDQCSQFTRTEKQTKHMKKCSKRPEWNINKPLKGYIPASEKYPKQLQKQREEKKVRRQMELLHLVERNNPGNLSQNRGTSPVLHSSHQDTEPKFRWHLVKKEEEPLKINYFSKERSQSPPVPVIKNRTQQTLKKSNYEREDLISGGNQTELSPRISEPSHFIPYVRTNEIYYLDPDAPLSRPLTQDPQYQNPHNCDQERQLFDLDRDPLLNPNLVKNRDRQQAILKGLSELRQGLLQKQRELETNLMPLAANQEDNFSSSFSI